MRRNFWILIAFFLILPVIITSCEDDEEEDAQASVYVYESVRSHCDPLVLNIGANQTITINTTDSVITNIHGWVEDCDFWTDADGIPDCHYVGENPDLHGLPFMALIGTTGDDYFLVGTYYQKTFSSAVSLALSVNDWGGCGDDSDNVGKFVINVMIE